MSTAPQEPSKDGDEPQVSIAETMREALGGVRGMIDSGLPSMVFVVMWLVSGRDLRLSLLCAVATGAAVALLRLLRREKLQQVVSGFVGVAISAFIADRTHRASNFFLPGILTNAAYLAALLVSIAVRKPLIGYLAALFRENFDWRNNPDHLRRALRASWVWVAIFAAKLLVQVPLLRADQTTALGIAKIAMGYPLFIAGGWITWRMLRRDAD
ncbi:MAG: DUF3159 domain-containing protein [Actinobacteria bacterium]|nr:DUF3159 domain-containing protein [Actinomycetota bacterium]